MDLIFDVGNTNIVIGVYNDNNLVNLGRYATKNLSTSDEVGVFTISLLQCWNVDIKSIDRVAISSVVPDVMHSLKNGVRKYINLEPLVVDCSLNSNIDLSVLGKPPVELGADRFVNCVSGFEKYGGNLIIIDFGTATTYDVINSDGKFISGITSPGIRISAEALTHRAALLGNFQIKKPENFLATNTIESLQSGLVYGQIGQTEYIVKKIREELNEPNMKVVATGGLSAVLVDGTNIFDIVDSQLTLDGIKILLDMNK